MQRLIERSWIRSIFCFGQNTQKQSNKTCEHQANANKHFIVLFKKPRVRARHLEWLGGPHHPHVHGAATDAHFGEHFGTIMLYVTRLLCDIWQVCVSERRCRVVVTMRCVICLMSMWTWRTLVFALWCATLCYCCIYAMACYPKIMLSVDCFKQTYHFTEPWCDVWLRCLCFLGGIVRITMVFPWFQWWNNLLLDVLYQRINHNDNDIQHTTY